MPISQITQRRPSSRPQAGRDPRNRWSRSIGTPGRDQSEWLVAITRCAQGKAKTIPLTRGLRCEEGVEKHL